MIALYVIGVALLPLVTWILYLAVMMLKQKRSTLPKVTKAFGWIVFGIGWIFDLVFNLLASILFADIPQELMFTDRVSRLKKTTGWRSKLAHWFCNNLLEPFDPGHCK